MRIALNNHFGGFRLSDKARAILNWGASTPLPADDGFTHEGWPYEMDDRMSQIELRSNPQMIVVLEGMTPEERHFGGDRGDSIRIVEVPDDAVTLYITDYDGREGVTWSMAEVHHA